MYEKEGGRGILRQKSFSILLLKVWEVWHFAPIDLGLEKRVWLSDNTFNHVIPSIRGQ